MKKISYILCLSMLLLGACKKGDLVENTEYTKIPVGDPAYSFLRFINLTPGSPIVNYYLNDVRSSGNATSIGQEAGFGYISAFPISGASYVPGRVGENLIKANIVSSALADANVTVLNASITAAAGKYYTLFTTGQYNTTSKKIESSLLIEDVRPALDTTKVFLKIINLCVGSPNVNFVQTTNPQKIITNIAYGAASSFVEIPTPGKSNVYSFTNANTDAVIMSSIATGTVLTKGYAYTYILTGVEGSATYPPRVVSYATFF